MSLETIGMFSVSNSSHLYACEAEVVPLSWIQILCLLLTCVFLFDSNYNLAPVYTSYQTVKFLKSCHLEVGMKNNVKWELNPEIVARHFFKNVSVPRHCCPCEGRSYPWEGGPGLIPSLGKGVFVQPKLGKVSLVAGVEEGKWLTTKSGQNLKTDRKR